MQFCASQDAFLVGGEDRVPEATLDAVELLYTSLLVQADTAMLREGAKKDAEAASIGEQVPGALGSPLPYRLGWSASAR